LEQKLFGLKGASNWLILALGEGQRHRMAALADVETDACFFFETPGFNRVAWARRPVKLF
jgi:hypothetical protein